MGDLGRESVSAVGNGAREHGLAETPPEDRLRVELSPDEIGGDFAPRPRESVVSYRFDEELLIVDGETGRIHVLNSIAAIVWECFDGSVTLDELSPELSDAFQAPLDTVSADTLTMTRQVANLGLLDGVAPVVPKPPPPPGVREVGEQIGPINVRTSSGELSTVPRPGANGTLIVNWSPSCGYCIKIVGDLERYLAGLTEAGIDLVLLTVGSDEDNRRILDPAGLADAAFYRSEASSEDPECPPELFSSFGTPVAYLLDTEGRVSQPIAMGADQVPKLARQAAGLAPEPVEVPVNLSPAKNGDQPLPAPRPTLPAAGGMCGPAAKLGGNTQQWASTAEYEIGPYHVGIRVDSSATDDVVGRALGEYRSHGETAAAPNFSVVLGGAGSGDTKALSLLLVADTTVVRSRSRRRVLRALQARLSALLDDDDDALLRSPSVGALIGDDAVLLPPAVIRYLKFLQPRLTRLGIRLSDHPQALIDPVTVELVVPQPRLQLDPKVLGELGELPQSRSELPPLEPGRYPLRAWSFEHPSEPMERVSRAGAIAALLPYVEASPDRLSDLIGDLGGLTEKIEVVPLQSTSEQDLMQSVESRLVPVL